MAVEVIEKRKGATVCASCGEERDPAEVAKSKACTCGESEVKKSLVIVRKAVGDSDEEVAAELDNVEDVDDEDDEDDDLDDEDDDLDDEDDEDEDDDEDEEDEDEDEDDDTPPAGVKKSDVTRLGHEALNISTALAEDIVKVFKEGGGESDYESTMVEFNDLMDAAAAKWFAGKNVSKSDVDAHKTLITERVEGIMGKSKTTKVKKSADQYAGLPASVVKSLKAADKIVEESEVKKWNDVVENEFTHFPGDKVELAKTLRSLSESNPTAFEELKKTLVAANYNLEQSDIFKRHGSNAPVETDEVKKRQSRAQEIAKAENITIEQAEVRLLDENAAASYQPTNA